MNANELIEAIRDTGAITIEMKKRIIPATLLVAGALFMACQPVAWGATSSSYTKEAEILVTKDFSKCTPSWVHNLPRAEVEWMNHEIDHSKGLQRIMVPHGIFSIELETFERSIQRERHWLKANYGRHGYESHKISLAIDENYVASLKKQERDDPRSSLCAYLPHMFRMLNYRYQHHDYITAAERKADAKIAKIRAEIKSEKEKVRAMKGILTRHQRHMLGMLIDTIKTQVSERWVPVSSSALDCEIQIHLGPKGQLLGAPVIVKSSGNAHFNHLVVAAVETAAPFVPPIGLPYSAFNTPINLKMNAEDLNHG